MIDLATLPEAANRLAGADWRLCVTLADAWATPAEMDAEADWLRAQVPGTAAAALEAAGRFSREDPMPLHDKDVWYRCRIEPARAGRHILRCDGLATVCEAWIDGAPLLASDSMYQPLQVEFDLDGPAELVFCFRALTPHFARKGPRARWRTRLVDEPGLRMVRSTLLGHMPGWCPSVHAVGPWRAMTLAAASEVLLHDLSIRSTLRADGIGELAVALRPGEAFAAGARIACAGMEAPLEQRADGRLAATLELPDIDPWWPHTHGTPALHEVRLGGGDHDRLLGRTGFRRIEVDRGPDGEGFGLLVNGVSVFCRGAVWTSADICALPGTVDAYRPWLELARDAHMNMLRIGGTMAPESPAFFQLCDEFGLLVWQDLPFANFDYPASDPDFAAKVARETADLLAASSASPSLAVICGGSEMHQQGAMMGLPEERWRGALSEEILPEAAASARPDVPYVPNSPSGGAMPFSPNSGIAHYYGVGAYRRPLEDARRAHVRFAGECLAFSNVPEPGAVCELAPCHHPDWKRGVPRDRDVGWDFEDVRDHYVRELYGIEPLDLRYGDPAAYLDHGRAAVAEVMEATFAEWRRQGSGCGGALVWTFQDLMPGAGWGVVACDGTPKSAWHGLRRAFAPLRLTVSDEGTNGLDIHLQNDGPAARHLRLEIACLREGHVPVASGGEVVEMPAHGSLSLPATRLIGAFFDTTLAFRFGPPSHDCVHVRLLDAETGAVLDEAFHFPLGRGRAARGAKIAATVVAALDGGWCLELSTDRVAQSVAIRDETFLALDNGFHLAPGTVKRVELRRRASAPAEARPRGQIVPLAGLPVPYAAG